MIETIGEQLEVEGEAHVEHWLQSIRDQLGQAESLEDFRNQLDSLIPELSYAEYGRNCWRGVQLRHSLQGDNL